MPCRDRVLEPRDALAFNLLRYYELQDPADPSLRHAAVPGFRLDLHQRLVEVRVRCTQADLEFVPENASDLSDEMPYHRGVILNCVSLA